MIRSLSYLQKFGNSYLKANTVSTLVRFYAHPICKFIEKCRIAAEPDTESPEYRYHKLIPEQPEIGSSASLNWSLCKFEITPYYQAYWNTPYDILEKKFEGYPNGYIDENHVFHVPHFETPDYDKFVFQDEKRGDVWPESVKKFNQKYTSRVQNEIAYYFSYVGWSFSQALNMNSYGKDCLKLRVITDNAATAVFLKNMALPIPKNTNPLKYKTEAFIYHAPGYQFLPTRIIEEFKGPKPSDLGLTREEFIVTADHLNIIMISGISSTKILQESLVYLASRLAVQRLDSLVIQCDTIINDDGEVMMIVNNQNDIAQVLKDEIHLYGAHHNMWNKQGVSRVWGGVCLETNNLEELGKLKEGTLVERIEEEGKYRVYKHLGNKIIRPNLIKHPKSFVIMIKDESETIPLISKISYKNASKLYSVGLIEITKDKEFKFAPGYFITNNYPPAANPFVLGDLLHSFMEESNTDVYVVNSNYDQDAKQVIHKLFNNEQLEIENDSWFSSISTEIENKLATFPEKPKEKYIPPKPKHWCYGKF